MLITQNNRIIFSLFFIIFITMNINLIYGLDVIDPLMYLDPIINAKLSGILPEIKSYMSLEEIKHYLPKSKIHNVNTLEQDEIARLLQFFEFNRYLDCFYNNKIYNSGDYKKFYISLSSNYVKLYDQNETLLCVFDKMQNRFFNVSRSSFSYWNFYKNIKKT
jgi:hypothetical protein